MVFDLILMTKMDKVEEVLENQERYGIDKSPDLTNLNREADHQRVG